MINFIQSPGKYVQGPNALSQISKYANNNALVITSQSGLTKFKSLIEKDFKDNGLTVEFVQFGKECSKKEVNRIAEIFKRSSAKVIVGVGGGKTLDCAKAVAYVVGSPVIIAPTIASTDAPCSALTVYYTENHQFDEYLVLPKNPDVVLMDTTVIANAPARFLSSGMGDALATYFEARACQRSGAFNMGGGRALNSAFALAKLCNDVLFEDGLKAYYAVQNNVVTEAVENIIEANTYLSGLGFESGGLAAAHAVHNGLTALEECHEFYHGEKVAFGTLVQLFLENAPLEEINEVIEFCLSINLPTTLEALNVKDVSREKLYKVAELACAKGETIYNMGGEINPELVLAAIITADSYSRQYQGI